MLSNRRAPLWLNAAFAMISISAFGTIVTIAYLAQKTDKQSGQASAPATLGTIRSLREQAVVAEQKGDLIAAEKAYRSSVGLSPRSLFLRLELAHFYDRHQMEKEAWEEYHSLVQTDITQAQKTLGGVEDLARYGDLCLKLGRKSEAEAAYRQIAYGFVKRANAGLPLNQMRSRVYYNVAVAIRFGRNYSIKAPREETPADRQFRLKEAEYHSRAVEADPTAAVPRLALAAVSFPEHKDRIPSLIRQATIDLRAEDVAQVAEIQPLFGKGIASREISALIERAKTLMDIHDAYRATRFTQLLIDAGRRDEARTIALRALPFTKKWPTSETYYLSTILASLGEVAEAEKLKALSNPPMPTPIDLAMPATPKYVPTSGQRPGRL